MTRAAFAWRAYALVAAALALIGVANWLWAITLRGPVMYGEGAVAHAALLARNGLEYTVGASTGDLGTLRPIFTAANYPPLYFHIAGTGDPFVVGRIVSVASVLFVAGAIAWRARPAGPLVAASIALAWLGSVPVLNWAPAVKPDLLALGLTVAAVMALDGARPRHVLAGALLAAAALTKPTALLPAAALVLYVARRSPLDGVRIASGGLACAVVLSALTHGPDSLVRVHVIDWNALAWRLELLAPLVLIAMLLLVVPVVTVLVTRPSTTVVTAYATGAIGVLLLGGREGATINYALDLSAAIALAIAGRAPMLSRSAAYPVAATLQLLVGGALLNPFAAVPSALQPTGKWGDPGRIEFVRDFAPGAALVEDSGLLVANGREPIVDDVFLWSRNHERERLYAMSFNEGERLLQAVRAGAFDVIVTEVELEQVATSPGFERQRWHPELVAAVLERYAKGRSVYGLCPAGVWCQQLFVYQRRSP